MSWSGIGSAAGAVVGAVSGIQNTGLIVAKLREKTRHWGSFSFSGVLLSSLWYRIAEGVFPSCEESKGMKKGVEGEQSL